MIISIRVNIALGYGEMLKLRRFKTNGIEGTSQCETTTEPRNEKIFEFF